jgi:pimeloyl-ACP methyl ester carboxylesterase
MITDFDVAFDGTVLKGDHYVGAHQNNLLYLHGAGASTRKGHDLVRSALQRRGVGSTCFDCIGHGDTGGPIGQSSVASRTRQAQAVIAARGMDQPLAIFGSSMGAYNAIRLTELHSVDALVLVVPGVYTPSAYEVPFGAEFSAVIRRERSWADSDAWEILSRFEGSLLVIAAEHDATIPREIPERLVAAATSARSRRLHVVPGASHSYLWALMMERQPEFDAMVDLVVDSIRS